MGMKEKERDAQLSHILSRANFELTVLKKWVKHGSEFRQTLKRSGQVFVVLRIRIQSRIRIRTVGFWAF
jgi:hypothetical protein